MNPYIKKKPKKITDIFKLSWDKPIEQKPQDLKSMKKALKNIYSIYTNRNKRKKP